MLFLSTLRNFVDSAEMSRASLRKALFPGGGRDFKLNVPFNGQWGDPQVGRDVLVGVGFGVGTAFLFGDEFHTLRDLPRGYRFLLTHFDNYGSGMALPLLQRVLVDLFWKIMDMDLPLSASITCPS